MLLGLKLRTWMGGVAVAALVAGCAGDDDVGAAATDDGTSTGGDADPLELDDRVVVFVASRCEQIATCDCETAIDVDDCIAQDEAVWTSRFLAGQERGLTLDEACLDDNLVALQTAECRWPTSVYAGEHLCQRFCSVFHGDRQLGESCDGYDTMVSDCAPGLLCNEGACVDPCGPLTGLSQGQYCRAEGSGPFETCARGLHCDWETSTCRPDATLGQSCQQTQCGPDLWCEWMTNVCVATAGPGEACDDLPCNDGLFCSYESSGVTRCLAPSQAGQSCANNVPCVEGLVCNGSTCVAPPPAGQTCLSGQCAETAVCDWNTDTCVARPVAGQACLFGACAEGLWCDTVTDPSGVCSLTRPNGEPCTGHLQCEDGFCPRGYCEPRPGLGGDCTNLFVCQPGLVCNGATCQPTDYRGPAACVYDGW